MPRNVEENAKTVAADRERERAESEIETDFQPNHDARERADFLDGMMQRLELLRALGKGIRNARGIDDPTSTAIDSLIEAFGQLVQKERKRPTQLFGDGTLQFIRCLAEMKPDGNAAILSFDLQTLVEVNAILEAGVQTITKNMADRMRGREH